MSHTHQKDSKFVFSCRIVCNICFTQCYTKYLNLVQHTEPGQWANLKMPNSGGKEHKNTDIEVLDFLYSLLYFSFVID